MEVSIALDSSRLHAEPGGAARGQARIHNRSNEALTLDLDVDGDAAPWAWVLPPEVSLAPGEEAGVDLGFRLPLASDPPAGALGWRLRARARSTRETVGRALGTLEVAPFSEISVDLSPARASGRGPVRYELSVRNRGNAPAPTALTATAEDRPLALAIEPPMVVVEAGRRSVATLTVTPRARVLTGTGRSLPFTVSAAPQDGGASVSASGVLHQDALVSARVSKVLVGLVAIIVVGAALRATVLKSGTGTGRVTTGSGGPPSVTAAGGEPSDPACPAKGHLDTRANGLRPQDIPTLPATYSFSRVAADGCTPVRWNPCDPIHFVVNPADAPPSGLADVGEAFTRLSMATGVTFADDGTTDEAVSQRLAADRRSAGYEPERYGRRWAPILVAWSHGIGAASGDIEVVGGGSPTRVGDVLVSGTLILNVDAVVDPTTRMPLEGGFGPPAGSGAGPIGPRGVTWGRVILHELSHIMGLGHTRDRSQLMYPETTAQTSRPVRFGESDLAGLRLLGRPAGCVAVPTLPTA
jgi:hypothetical protein